MDRIGHVDAAFASGASNPGVMREYIGGGMLNALRVACWRGVAPVALVSVRGGDNAALSVDRAIEAAGLHDLSGQFLDRQTASYTAIHGADGDVVAALADMAIYETCLPRQIRRKPVKQAIAGAKALIVDANMPASAIVSAIGGTTGAVYAMAISPAKIARLAETLPHLDGLFANTREIMALTGERDRDAAINAAIVRFGLRGGVITDGPRPATIIEHGKIIARLPPHDMQVRDVTGAGDALTGGTIAALMAGAPLAAAVRQGMACAACAISIQGPISDSADLADFTRYYEALNNGF